MQAEFSLAQHQNYLSVNLQTEFSNPSNSVIDIKVLILSASNDTIWLEFHQGVTVESSNTFVLEIGKGVYIAGSQIDFSSINWKIVDKVQIIRSETSETILGDLFLKTVPYSYHSLTIESIPLVANLIDVSGIPNPTQILKYDSSGFIFSDDLLSDSALFAYYTLNSNNTDTALVGISTLMYVDTANYAFFADTVQYSNSILNAIYADSVLFSDTASFAFYTQNAWQINGNQGNALQLGTLNNVNFSFATNGTNRFIFAGGNSISNGSLGAGKNFTVPNGAIWKTNGSNPAVSLIPNAHFYFDGSQAAFTGGTSNLGLDTLLGNYSFTWGENVGTNGAYSTVFGKNSSGDSSLFSGVMYESTSSFAAGSNCHVARMSVAMGYNAKAGYYRNVAIGKDVQADVKPASLAIGTNVVSVGSTSWAMGNNLIATGNFSTVLGTNASSNLMSGTFLYGDFSTTDTVLNTNNHQFMARSSGGVIIYSSSDLSMGVTLSPGGGSWNMVSDRNKKMNIRKLNPLFAGEYFNRIKVYQWNYKGQNVTHVGPIAQDFYTVFEIGESDKFINQLDIDGVVLFGVKTLNNELQTISNVQDNLMKRSLEIDQESDELKKLEQEILELYEKLDN